MFYAILTVHFLLCVGLIGLVLLQQGKGADMGAAFSGGSNTLFGASGATAVITKITTGMAVAFFVTSILLVKQYGEYVPAAVTSSDPARGSVMEGVVREEAKAAPQTVPLPQQAPQEGSTADSNSANNGVVNPQANGQPETGTP